MRINCGMGKSTMPNLSWTLAFTSPRTLISSLRAPVAIPGNSIGTNVPLDGVAQKGSGRRFEQAH